MLSDVIGGGFFSFMGICSPDCIIPCVLGGGEGVLGGGGISILSSARPGGRTSPETPGLSFGVKFPLGFCVPGNLRLVLWVGLVSFSRE